MSGNTGNIVRTKDVCDTMLSAMFANIYGKKWKKQRWQQAFNYMAFELLKHAYEDANWVQVHNDMIRMAHDIIKLNKERDERV